MQKSTLIIDRRKELSIKYKKLIEGVDNYVIIARDLQSAMLSIQENEPDLIIVSDSIEENLADFCKKLRVLTFNMRPVIVAISKSAELEDKIRVLEEGADDFLSEPINSEEFKMRIKAHLRREYEVNVNLKTMLPNKNYSMKVLKRILAKNSSWAAMLVSVENFDNYKEIYSELASDKLMQTFCAIITSALDKEDFIGHVSSNEFLIVTHPMRVEKIASFLVFAFDSVAVKFYSPEDAKRGYAILQGDERAGRRSEFVSTSIGIVSNEFKKYSTASQVINSLINIKNLAKRPSCSSYAIERPKLSAKDSVEQKSFNNKVLVVEEDEALAFLLETTLNLQGYDVEVIESFKDFDMSDISNVQPAVIIIDVGKGENLLGLEVCRELKQLEKLSSTKVVATSIFHDKELILNTGADLYLPKPYELSVLMHWLKIFIREFNQ